MRIVRIMFCTALLTSLCAGVGSAAPPGPPDPATSIAPLWIRVVGTSKGAPDRLGTFTVLVRDAAMTPISDIPVTVDFSRCSDVRLSLQQGPGATLLCANNTVSVMTDAAGIARFTVIGASSAYLCGAATCPPGEVGRGCALICAAGVPLSNASALVYDLDGAGGGGGDGINSLDLRYVQNDQLCSFSGGGYRVRTDYDMNGIITFADVSRFISDAYLPAMVGNGSAEGSGGSGFCVGPFVPFSCP